MTPPYHLRTNKAVDRLAFIDAIGRLGQIGQIADFSDYTYYGFGGPYLEDFRILYEAFPKINMVSIESKEEVCKRQNFNLPCGSIKLKNSTFSSFLAEYQPENKSIFWLDYTELKYNYFDEFMALLQRVEANSMVKITLCASPQKYKDKGERFRNEFEAIMPVPTNDPPSTKEGFARLLQEMLQICVQKALPSAVPLMFQPISSFFYADGVGMFTLTGVVCLREERDAIRRAFERLEFVNLDWKYPMKIDVPNLSTRERLHLQRLLPCTTEAGSILRRTLGYLLDEKTEEETEAMLKQYAAFHRYFPYFLKAIP